MNWKISIVDVIDIFSYSRCSHRTLYTSTICIKKDLLKKFFSFIKINEYFYLEIDAHRQQKQLIKYLFVFLTLFCQLEDIKMSLINYKHQNDIQYID